MNALRVPYEAHTSVVGVALRRVPPYEACGGATGFSPWGLHQFPSKIWKRNSIIIFKNSHFIPHIYFTTSLGLINGDIDTLLPMAETKYLEGKPALVFTRQPDSP